MVAASEVYVEVAIQDGTTESFDFMYALTICTVGFLKQYLEECPFYAQRSLIVVNRFDDQIIKDALEAILPNIDSLAIKK